MKLRYFWIFLGLISLISVSCKKGDDDVPGSQVTGYFLKVDVDTTNGTSYPFKFTTSVPAGTFSSSAKSVIITAQSLSPTQNLSITLDIGSANFNDIAAKTYPLQGSNMNSLAWNTTETSVGVSTSSDNVTITSVTPTNDGKKVIEGTFSGSTIKPGSVNTTKFINGSFKILIIP